jgi:hypothetical protein
VPPPSPYRAAVVSFPGHLVVSADVDRRWLDTWTADGDLAGPMSPAFLSALEHRLRLSCGSLDALVLATPLAGDPPVDLKPIEDSNHPRVRRAQRLRTDVRAWAYESGVLTVGRGLTGRWETGVEVDEASRPRGTGRLLAHAARHLVAGDRLVWAQVAPGNAASLRAFLAAGYLPVGAEVLLSPFGSLPMGDGVPQTPLGL